MRWRSPTSTIRRSESPCAGWPSPAHLTLGYGAHPLILSGGLNLASTDADARTDAVTQVKGAIDQAAELGITMVTLLDGPNSAPSHQVAKRRRSRASWSR